MVHPRADFVTPISPTKSPRPQNQMNVFQSLAACLKVIFPDRMIRSIALITV